MKTTLFWNVPARVKLALVLLAVLPCVPGLTFLIAGWVRDPLWPAQDPTPAMRIEYQRAAGQANALYRAGGVALGMGVLCGTFIGWKIIRRREADTEGNTGKDVPL